MPITSMSVAELNVGETGILLEITASAAQKSFLQELGFTPQCRIELLRTAPFGDPLHVRVRDSEFALRKRDAKELIVRVTP